MLVEEEATTKKVLEDVCRILKEEKDLAKRKKFVESVVNALSDGYGEGPNFEDICNAAAKLARSSHRKIVDVEKVEDTLANVLPTEDLDTEDLMKMPWMWCITLTQLKQIAKSAERLHGKKWYENADMHQIVKEIILPICARTKKGYWASQNPEGLKVTVFVTHSWRENFKEMVDSISSVFKNSLQEPHLWICAFALIQGDYNVIKAQVGTTSSSSLPSSVLLRASPFVQALEKADSFLVVRNSTGDLYTRIWCVCELMYAMEFGLVPSRTYITGPDDFADNTSSCLEAESSVPEDKEIILQYLTSAFSAEEVDEKIKVFRNLKLPTQTNSAQRLKRIIGFLLFCLVAAAITSIILLRPRPLTIEEELQKNIIEPKLSEKIKDNAYSIFCSFYRKDALDWLTNEIIEKNININEEREILMKYCLITIYYSMGGPTWSNVTNWLSNKSVCSWYGITCSEEDAITELRLAGNKLKGRIPDEIYYFRSLKVIDVGNNDITGPFGNNLGLLQYLKVLDISSNSISGTINSNLGLLQNLEVFDISNNNIAGTISSNLASLKHLRLLDISSNRISGISSDIASLPALSSLWLHSNELTGLIPKGIIALMEDNQKNYSNLLLMETPTSKIALSSYGTPQFESFQTVLYHNEKSETSGPLRTYTHIVRACVTGDIIKKYPNKSVEECEILCNARDDCYGFEYGVYYGGSGNYQPRDCHLSSTSNITGCNATHHNLDFYRKEILEGYRLIEKGCVSGKNMQLYKNKSMEECAKLCDKRDGCRGFEYDVTYGEISKYKPRDCQLSSSSNIFGCNGGNQNLDFYIKEDDKLFRYWQQYALSVLFFSTDGKKWSRRNNWLTQRNFCDWEGVTCNDNDEVVILNMNDNRLRGSLPKELAVLTKLSSLDLSFNDLTGTVPTELGTLILLNKLDLSNNRNIFGNIPDSLCYYNKQVNIVNSGIEDCISVHKTKCGSKDTQQKDYRGKVNTTRSGFECQRWDTQYPHEHTITAEKYPQAGLENNYCRKPDDAAGPAAGPWCFTMNETKRWEYCNIPYCEETCGRKEIQQRDYRGNVSTTISGFECQRWDTQDPHQHSNTHEKKPEFGLENNYCRNPDNADGPWCYTMNPTRRWEYCNIPYCEDLD